MKTLRSALCFSLSVVIPAFALSTGQKPYPVVTEVKDGVKTIVNPDFPRDGRFTAILTEELSCGEESADPAGVLNKPLRLEVDGQGRIYVSDYGDANIKVYDGQGRFLRTIGRKGQGPGEFGGMVFFSLMTDNRICVLDFMQNRVIIMTAEGQYVSGFLLKEFFAAAAVDGRDRLFLAKRGAVREPDKLSTEFQEIPYITSIFRTDAAGQERVHLMDFLGENMAMKSAGGGNTVMTGGLYTIVWTINRAGTLYGGFNVDYRIGVFAEDGKKDFVFGRQFEPAKNPRFKGLAGQRKAMPAYRALLIDEDGNLWVEVVQAEDAKGVIYDVFSADGIFCKQVSIEQRIGAFKSGRVYSIVRPEEGFPSVKRYKLELEPSGK